MVGSRRLNLSALFSVVIAALLCMIGVIRMLSYSRGSAVTLWLLDSPLAAIAYRPDVPWSVRLFKVVSTPVIAAGFYFLFRLLNRAAMSTLPGAAVDESRRIDFVSPWTRIVLTSVISLHWIPIEFMKFRSDGFYPNSSFEDPWINFAVLAVSQLLAFVGMRYLSFEPLVRESASP